MLNRSTYAGWINELWSITSIWSAICHCSNVPNESSFLSELLTEPYITNRNLFAKHLFKICWKQKMLILFRKKNRKNMYLDNFLQIGWTLTFLLQPNCIIVIQRLFSKKEMPNLVRLFFLLVFILTQNFLRKLFSFWHIFCMILTNVHVCHYYPGLFLS